MPLPSHGRSTSPKQREIELSVLQILRQNRSSQWKCQTNFIESWIIQKSSNEGYETCGRLSIIPSSEHKTSGFPPMRSKSTVVNVRNAALADQIFQSSDSPQVRTKRGLLDKNGS